MTQESVIQEELAELFDGGAARGAFATHWRGTAADLHVEVKDVGPLRFPISQATVRTLRSVARPARFGKGEATLLDKSVRDTWVIAKSRVKIDQRRWRATLAPALERIHRDLELPPGTSLRARLHDLLVYEEGQFFLAHRDAEKSPEMVGTLVVLLPSTFEGGASVISHEGEQVVCRGSSKKELTFLAFFSDCEHEVQRVEKGHRVALTYELELTGTPTAPVTDASLVESIQALLRDHFETPVPVGYRGGEAPPDRFVYLLDHQYTPKGLSWRRLKGVDAARAAALRAAAEATDREIHLATAEIHERWTCESEDDYGYGYRGRGRYPVPRDDDDDEHPPLVELIDSEIVLDDWVDADDRRAATAASGVASYELCFSRPTDELTPVSFEHEGYMGNWGDTVDRWYRRAAVVLWPRDRAFLIRGKHDAPWALRQVRDALRARGLEHAREMIRQLLPHWPNAVRSTERDIARDVLRVADRVDDAELAAGWVAPLSLDRVGHGKELAALVERYGAAWLEERFAAWGRHGTREVWQRRLPDVAAALPATPTVRAWFHQRLAAEQATLVEAYAEALRRGGPRAITAALEALAPPLLAVLRAAVRAHSDRVRDALCRQLVPLAEHVEARAWAVGVLRAARAEWSPAELEAARLSGVARALALALEADLAVAPRADDDWSIDAKLRCSCALCRTLAAFLSNGDERSMSWPIAKEKRQHVHRAIDALEVPVKHTTMRRGSPYTLMLEKTDALFTRERASRARARDDLAWLEAWPAR